MSSVKTRKLDISTILAVVRAQNSAGSIDSWTLNTATEDIYNNNNSGKVAINKDTANYTLDVSGNFKANIIIDKNNSSGVPGQFLSTNGDELEWKAGSGTQGPQGDAGPAGGPQGNTGTTGVQGPQGWQGRQGNQGWQGVIASLNAINVYSTATFTPSVNNTAEKFPLNTSITSVYNSGFSTSFTSDRITYTGTTGNFLISVQLNGGQTNSGTAALGFEIRKNGTVIAGSPRAWQTKQFSGGQYIPIACSQIVSSLANTNYIEVFCTCSDITNVTPAAFTGYTPTGLNTMPTISVAITQIN